MSDKNSVDVAQATHRHLLKRAGCLCAHEEVLYPRPLPDGPVYEGIYLDDRVVVAVAENGPPEPGQTARDELLMNRARAAYKEHNLPISDGKSFDKAENFVAWGTEIKSKEGSCGAL